MIIWHLFWQLNIRFIFGYYKSHLFCSYKFHRCLYWIRKYVLPYHNLLLPLFGVSKSFHLKFSSPENLVFNEIIFCNQYFLSTSADRSSSSSPNFPRMTQEPLLPKFLVLRLYRKHSKFYFFAHLSFQLKWNN